MAGIAVPWLKTIDARSQDMDIKFVEAAFIASLSQLKNAVVSVEDHDESHVALVVRGIKGQIIVGSNYWEKITAHVFLWRNFVTSYDQGDPIYRGFHSMSGQDFRVSESLRVRVVMDGLYSAGSGEYPKDEFFTENMEPRFHDQLTEFANIYAKKFAERMAGGELK
jgi:hypothetical protein